MTYSMLNCSMLNCSMSKFWERGFIQIPILIFILLVSGGAVTVFQKVHPTSQGVINKQKEVRNSDKQATPSAVLLEQSNKSKTKQEGYFSSQPNVTPSKVSSSTTANYPTSTPFQSNSFKSSSTTVMLTPPSDSYTPNASGQFSIEVYRIDPYNATGKIASFRVTGSVYGLQPNTSYGIGFSPPHDPGSAIGVTDFIANNSGNSLIEIHGKAISYYPSNPNWSISVYQKGNSFKAAVKGNFSISNDIISANNPPTAPQSTTKLDSISPNPTKYGDLITLKGSGFGSSGQYVVFTNPYGYTSGAGVISWNDTEIKAYVPPTKGENKVQVEGPNGVRSNVYILQVTLKQPYISSMPYSSVPGREITISGEEFGANTGAVNLYGPSSSTTPAGNCNVTSWSDTQIKCTLPDSLSTTGYYDVSIAASDGRQASYKTLYMCSPIGCG